MIPVICAHCGLRILVPPTVQGRKSVCFGCGAPVTAPTAAVPANRTGDGYTVGDVVSDRYRLEERVGRGGMGTVFRALDTLVNETVALKFLHTRYLRTQRGQRLFMREAQVTRRLRHEYIVTTHDVGCTPEGVLYLSMEFLDGRPLRQYLRERREQRRLVSVRLAVHLISQVLAALDYAHRMVTHRDLKPENIMLLPAERIKVLDFGLAKALDEDDVEDTARSKQAGQIIGTLAYASPEQRMHHEVDGRSDLYAVGLLLHELLTLRTPLDPPSEIAAVRGDVAPSIIDCVQRALQPRREDRWQSAAEFRAVLLDAYDRAYRQAAVVATAPQGAQASTEGMVLLEGGAFLMGGPDATGGDPEFEAHVEAFYIDRHPVTVEQYAAYLKATGASEPKFWGQPEYSGRQQPVVGVTWDEARAYAAWAGKELPTEAQWEFAARGRENRRYPWGFQEPDSNLANFSDHLHMPCLVTMHEEGQTPDGVCDLAGNVYEWVLDVYAPYEPSLAGQPRLEGAPRRVARGGAWDTPAHTLRCTHRHGFFPETRAPNLGFRCVVPAASSEPD